MMLTILQLLEVTTILLHELIAICHLYEVDKTILYQPHFHQYDEVILIQFMDFHLQLLEAQITPVHDHIILYMDELITLLQGNTIILCEMINRLQVI